MNDIAERDTTELHAALRSLSEQSPRTVLTRVLLVRSSLARVADPEVRLLLERCLDGWFDA